MLKFIILLLFVFFSAFPLKAEVFKCQGVYKSRPCGSAQASNKSSALLTAAEPAPDVLLANKRRALSRLQSALNQVQRQSGYMEFELAPLETFCLRQEVRLEECQARLTKTYKESLKFAAAKVKAEQRAQELRLKERELDLRRTKFYSELKRKSRH